MQEDTVEQVSKAIWIVKNKENIIIVGDLNCRVDKPDNKTALMLEFLQEESFT